MSLWLLPIAALLLVVERVCYVWIARAPASFRRWCGRPRIARLGEPIAVVRALFIGFKVLQALVFAGWCLVLGDGSPAPREDVALGLGAVLILVGQTLSTLVFYRLGRVGIFFGDRLGHTVPWCHAFPFSLLSHPQYAGAVMTIWGFFLIARFPHDDWILLPALETIYYVAGAYLESDEQRWTARDLEYDATPSDRSPTRAR